MLQFSATEGVLPIALVGAVLVVLAWILGSVFGHGRRTAVWAALLTCVAVIGWVTIGLTVWTHDPGPGGVNLTVGQEIRRALDTGAGGPRLNLVGNVLLFIPFGVVVALLVRRGFVLRVLAATFAGAAFSAAIEATQFLLGRVADVDDVILNTGGAFLGALVGATIAGVRARTRRNYDGSRASSSVGRAADF